MTELSIRPEEIRDALQRFVSDYKPETASREEVGRVAETGDGIARVTGLPSAMANELLEFEGGTLGLALNLDTREIGVVILGDFEKIEEGQSVRRTGEILSVPVGEGYLGRVVDPLGNPIDGLGDIEAETRRIVDEGRRAPGHVFNLGHGVLPDTDPDVLTRLVELVWTGDDDASAHFADNADRIAPKRSSTPRRTSAGMLTPLLPSCRFPSPDPYLYPVAHPVPRRFRPGA